MLTPNSDDDDALDNIVVTKFTGFTLKVQLTSQLTSLTCVCESGCDPGDGDDDDDGMASVGAAADSGGVV